MRPRFGWACVLLMVVNTWSEASAANSGFDPKVAFFLRDGSGFSPEAASAALDAALAKGKPLLVYVHGRGKEPRKSLVTKKIVPVVLEDRYDVTVLMVSWDSHGVAFDRKRPLTKVPVGAVRLQALIEAIKARRATDASAGLRVSMLAHSMGGIVLQRVIEAGVWDDVAAPLFTSIVLSQPDADAQGHQQWLARLSSREQVYVTINRSDWVLGKAGSGRPKQVDPLGLKPAVPLVPDARYLRLTGFVGDKHQVFNKGSMAGNVAICRFFDSALKGRSVDLVALGWTSASGGEWVPPAAKDREDSCFKGVLEEEGGRDE